jgi:hypothetical protein
MNHLLSLNAFNLLAAGSVFGDEIEDKQLIQN